MLQPLIYDQPVPHDPSKFIMLGSANSDVYLCMRAPTPLPRASRTRLSKEVVIGTSDEGSTLREMPILLVNVLGAKLSSSVAMPGAAKW